MSLRPAPLAGLLPFGDSRLGGFLHSRFVPLPPPFLSLPFLALPVFFRCPFVPLFLYPGLSLRLSVSVTQSVCRSVSLFLLSLLSLTSAFPGPAWFPFVSRFNFVFCCSPCSLSLSLALARSLSLSLSLCPSLCHSLFLSSYSYLLLSLSFCFSVSLSLCLCVLCPLFLVPSALEPPNPGRGKSFVRPTRLF